MEELQNIKSAESHSESHQAYQSTSDPNLIAHQLDPNPVLKPLEFVWKGYSLVTQDDGTDAWQEDETSERVMNNKGISAIINKIRLRFNHFTSLSNLDDDTVWKFKEEVENDVNELLFKNEKKYDLKIAYYDSIITDVGQAVLFGMNRALNQGERNFLSKTTEVKQTFQEKDKPKRKFGLW